jgi:hypothetical protein
MSIEYHPIQLMAVTDVHRPSFSFSWISARDQELSKPSYRRVPCNVLASRAKNYPIVDPKEGQLSDKDVNLFLIKVIKDIQSERWKFKTNLEVIARREKEELFRILRRKINLAERSNKKELFAKAKAILTGAFVEKEGDKGGLMRGGRAERGGEGGGGGLVGQDEIQLKEDLEDSSFHQQYHGNGLPLPGTLPLNPSVQPSTHPLTKCSNSSAHPTIFSTRKSLDSLTSPSTGSLTGHSTHPSTGPLTGHSTHPSTHLSSQPTTNPLNSLSPQIITPATATDLQTVSVRAIGILGEAAKHLPIQRLGLGFRVRVSSKG